MPVLHNRIDQRELKALLYQETEPRVTLSFYQYCTISNTQLYRDELYKQLNAIKVFGRIYLATEGINAQVSVPQCNLELFKNYINTLPELYNVRLNIAVDNDGKSFWVLKIKVRDKIVADGITDPNFSMAHKGKYVNAEQMNNLLTNTNTVVVDMRNHYEYEVGHFTNAVTIPSDTFREQLPMAVTMLQQQKEQNIIMYCTGGIRCEKASAYMLHHGFKNVYHLEGGIINYAQQVKQQNLISNFIGKNFVFDDRLGERITDDIIAKCHQCGSPADTHTNCKNEACHLLFIQCTTCANTMLGCCSQGCKMVHQLPIEEQQQLRAGIDKGQQIFNKGKARLRPKL